MINTASMKHRKAFISHATPDKARFVLKFAEGLRAKGVDAWLDKWEMLPGDSLIDKIFDEGLSGADAFVIVLSEHSVKSKWVREELNTAVVQRITAKTRIVPVLIDNVEVPRVLTSLLYYRIADIDNFEDDLNKIVNAIYEIKEKPLLGNPPGFSTLSLNTPGDLKELDFFILKSVFDREISSHLHEGMQGGKIIDQAKQLNWTEDEILESVTILEEMGYLQVHWTLRFPGYTILTSEGFETVCLAAVPGYDDIQTSVGWALINAEERELEPLAKSLAQPTPLVEHILERMRAQGLINFRAYAGGGGKVIQISPMLKRRLSS